MTNKEILQADLLDILFENRNKAYGAYALRKNYNHRLQWALGISLSLVCFLLMIDFSSTKDSVNPFDNEKVLKLSTVEFSNDKPKKPDPPRPKVEPTKAQTKNTNQIKIVDDKEKTDVPEKDVIDKSLLSTKTIDGILSGEIVEINNNAMNGNGNNTTTNETVKEENRVFSHSDAEFPGGRVAFTEFLKKYLNTPDELEVGEKKMVLVRFVVDVDGTISKTEIVQSGGVKYDREVIRVLHKMPKWIPAMQNGLKVATYFTQPVTFIGIEE
jgi:protein TonB